MSVIPSRGPTRICTASGPELRITVTLCRRSRQEHITFLPAILQERRPMQSGGNDEIRRLAACLRNRPALPIGRSPDSTSKPSTHQTFQQCNRTRSAERRAREHERVTAEERGSPESGSGGGQRRGPVEERPQSTRGGRHGTLVGRCPQGE